MSKKAKKQKQKEAPVQSGPIDIVSLNNKVDGLYDLMANLSRRLQVVEQDIPKFFRDYEAHLHDVRLITGPKVFSPEVDRMIQESRNPPQEQPATGPPTQPEEDQGRKKK